MTTLHPDLPQGASDLKRIPCRERFFAALAKPYIFDVARVQNTNDCAEIIPGLI